MDHLDLALRFEAPTDAGEFSGHAVIWNERNAHNEIVRPGAFRKTLQEHRAAGTRPVMLWSHDPSSIIGVWAAAREDEKGLFVRGQLVTSTARGREAYDLLKAGALNGLSIGFRVPKGGETRQSGVRILTEIDVREISLVGMPSAGRARITQIRSYGRSVESVAAFTHACRKAQRALATKGK
ncbi:HK97 family phage prohead protease [Rhizobium deserti]|uniref:HK97 family phage prohead protease n=1 Tax=Rhizobium deserti TaxID=2547961 RepID=A0A4R5ULI8_9HYPH|nr:HK97 family phage prohead protease [Rhizobium deserti]TDK38599.1 HK97 family phage prohead protease [Rhizobium deserti]